MLEERIERLENMVLCLMQSLNPYKEDNGFITCKSCGSTVESYLGDMFSHRIGCPVMELETFHDEIVNFIEEQPVLHCDICDEKLPCVCDIDDSLYSN